ncbi:raffinose/stachyose/melibiose transport system permease protein [Paenibacillus sp. 1_12]|uniref:carbohydrate ABC transporter permease n=1 Tax=Paenibacillus sp. 1_12 TaxID=1566278 RepID=UPI0008F1100D|nr:sugar ABC transporter permease [Paenibacillus sp. 1_12]SFK79089.1 raffinose/stachyose/melibiose transport system permease protein [Paenibacillus sp. 1_12]
MGVLKFKSFYLVYIIPALVLYCIFFILPFIQTMIYSLYNWDGINTPIFIGMKNYWEMFHDSVFYASTGRVLKWALIQGIVQISIAMLLANVLKDKIKGSQFFRAVYFIPVVMSSAAICVMFTVMYDNDIGLLNALLRSIGLGNLAKVWLGDASVAFYAAIAVPIWQGIGLYMVILLSGLQSISEEIFESAKMDGANAWQQLTRITIPMMWGIIQICIILTVSGTFKNFDYVYILTAGGPGSSTHVLATYMYDKAFIGLRYGYGTAVAVIIFMLGLSFTVIFQTLTKTRDT